MSNRRVTLVLSLSVVLFAPVFLAGEAAAETNAAEATQGSAAEKKGGPTCKDNGECDRSQFCHRQAGRCNAPGRCEVRPQACPEIYDPVCGCDGKTYSNSCFAFAVGVNVKAAGACEKECSRNADCSKDQYCAKLTGDCDGRGRCTERPRICPEIYDPVCGCDKKTYGNSCEAAAGGTSVASLGECE